MGLDSPDFIRHYTSALYMWNTAYTAVYNCNPRVAYSILPDCDLGQVVHPCITCDAGNGKPPRSFHSHGGESQ